MTLFERANQIMTGLHGTPIVSRQVKALADAVEEALNQLRSKLEITARDPWGGKK